MGAASELSLLRRGNRKYQAQYPKGKMEHRLGKAYGKDDWYKSELNNYSSDEEKDNVDLLRAYPIECMIGKTIEVKDASDISAAIMNLLEKEMPDIEWRVDKDWSGPYRAYGIIHNSIDGPIDELTNEEMAIEIFGHRIFVNERGIQTIKILVATYANVSLPGIGVPFYL